MEGGLHYAGKTQLSVYEGVCDPSYAEEWVLSHVNMMPIVGALVLTATAMTSRSGVH